MTKYTGFEPKDFIQEIERLKGQRDRLLRSIEILVDGLKKNGGFNLIIEPAERVIKEVKGSP